MIERNTEYDPFAVVYDRFWGFDYHVQAFPIVQQLLLASLPRGAAILDVCCGTGKFTRKVCDRGFEVSGVDASEEMIRFARENAPRVKFVVADARDFKLGTRFQAAYSVFESLNHIRDLEGLKQAFRCIRRHLETGAPFLFDLNGEQAFQSYWNETNAIVEDDLACILQSEYDEATHTGTCEITVFEQDETETWNRYDFTVQQTCHDLAAVQAKLEETGFRDITFFDACDLGMENGTGYDRTFLLAKAA